jgi:hypothetical protein
MVRRTALAMNFPVVEEYDFKNDRNEVGCYSVQQWLRSRRSGRAVECVVCALTKP